MADALDIVNQLADDADNFTQPLVGRKFAIRNPADIARYGATFVMPAILVFPGKPVQQELEDRLALGKCTVSVEAEIHDGPVVTFINEGAQQDFVSRVPLTIEADNLGPGLWVVSGTATVGNLIGVQSGAIGASYKVGVNDTPAIIVASIAAACIDAGIAATANAEFLTIPFGAVVNLGAVATYVKAISRRTRDFYVFAWSTDPWIRQTVVKEIEKMYPPGFKVSMADGSELIITEMLGSTQEDPTGNGEQRDGLFVSRTGWKINFTVTQTVTAYPIVATTSSFSLGGDPTVPDMTAPFLASLL